MEKTELNDQGVLLLRNAIIEQAASDYVRYYDPDRLEQSSYIITIERWFRSKAFDALCTKYSGEWFIKMLREKALTDKKPNKGSCKVYGDYEYNMKLKKIKERKRRRKQ